MLIWGHRWGYLGHVSTHRHSGTPKMPTKKVGLTDVTCRNTKPTDDRDIKLHDGGGLFLLIRPTGSKLWRLKYRFLGREKSLSLGAYPDRSLANARDAAGQAKRLIQKGVDPSAKRQSEKATRQLSAATTFEPLGREWI